MAESFMRRGGKRIAICWDAVFNTRFHVILKLFPLNIMFGNPYKQLDKQYLVPYKHLIKRR